MNFLIDISVDPHGNFHYSQALLHVRMGDNVSWKCTSGFFSLQFSGGSPMNGMETFAPPSANSPLMTVTTSASGMFKYAVAVFDGTRVHLDAACPVLVAN